MKFSIVTPSFRQSEWLKLCIASIADQEGVDVEHIVQDACSDDGTLDWLPKDPRVKAFVEKDGGMYDAINRGFKRARGDILAYLNCDEQYLPGGLKTVQNFFEAHPEIDVVLPGTVVVDADGNYICHRHSLVPNRHFIWYRFPALTSSIFVRRRVVHDLGIYFDTRWRDVGDLHWMLALLTRKVPMAAHDEFVSVFADTGENMSLKPSAAREDAETVAMMPRWTRLLWPVGLWHHRFRRLAAGHFFLKPTHYSIYTRKSPDRRVRFEVTRPTAVWRGR